MSKELIEITSLLRMRFVTNDTCHKAADRIEELERDLLNLVCRIHRDGGHYIAKYGEAKAIADADTVVAQNNADLDALQADNARLREALEYCVTQVGELATVPGIASALSSTPEQSIAEYRNKVIEECAVKADALANCEENTDGYRNGAAWCAEAIRAMKEQL